MSKDFWQHLHCLQGVSVVDTKSAKEAYFSKMGATKGELQYAKYRADNDMPFIGCVWWDTSPINKWWKK